MHAAAQPKCNDRDNLMHLLSFDASYISKQSELISLCCCILYTGCSQQHQLWRYACYCAGSS
jgi:hypothetical protein